jgi:4-diphosphocytidyl-2-C-methyl-D-erythritol kinase
MIRFPIAKINLGLYITEKRADGYHNLETVFMPVATVQDILEAVPATGERPQMHLSGLPVAGDSKDNLVWKAYRLMHERFPDRIPALDWHLHKAIPMGAGLGGGSSDGAEALLLLNEMCKLRLPEATLLELALQLGSDCPFFIYGKPCFASGRGERLQPMHLNLDAYRIEVVPSTIHVSTGKAFGMLTPRPAPFDLRQLAQVPVGDWKFTIGNDFEDPVFAMHPELALAKQQLYDRGAVYAQMSGSGSALFALFRR